MAKQKIKPVLPQYKLATIQELEFSVLSKSLVQIDEEKLEISFDIGFQWNFDSDYFGIIINVEYFHPDKAGKTNRVVQFKGEVGFTITNLAQLNPSIKGNDPVVKMPRFFLAILTGIGLATVRGMIASRLQGSDFSRFHMPVISTMEIVDDLLSERLSD